MSTTEILKVDTKGFSKLLSENGIDWIPRELLQNAWDQNVTEVRMTIESVGHGRGKIVITDDDPDGFADLSHSFTLFAESGKKVDPTLRGRFNMGEKQVIAYCVETGGEVEILTTSGGYHFSKAKGRTKLRRTTNKGSQITCTFRASKQVITGMVESIDGFLPPHDFPTFVNGTELTVQKPYAKVTESLPTVIANDEGELTHSARKALVELHRAESGDTSMIYEMGIPIVENPTPYHVNVHQKVPLNYKRDSVTPAYLRKILTIVGNLSASDLTPEEVKESWVNKAMETTNPTATQTLFVAKHGKDAVKHNPSEPESSAAATAAGMKVVYGGNHTKAAWGNIDASVNVPTATDLFPEATVKYGDGPNVNIPKEKWTPNMATLAQYASWLHEKVHGSPITVKWHNDPRGHQAVYGSGLAFNKRSLGKRWIDAAVETRAGFQQYLDICIHEFAHKYGDSHYSDAFYQGCTKVGAKVAMILVEEDLPSWLD